MSSSNLFIPGRKPSDGFRKPKKSELQKKVQQVGDKWLEVTKWLALDTGLTPEEVQLVIKEHLKKKNLEARNEMAGD